ncbi:g8330 [Coccomyxa viridis]|uniref:G8330 protein n=1 Tax=Coccomyxa viridis TaxID=1274662 RepID=A0ABP1G2K6_9CHLO
MAKASDNSNSSTPAQQGAQASESILGESDSTFFVKLLVISFAGAAAVKYGSLLLDTPFQPSLAVGLSIIAAPCVAFAVYLGSRSR